MITEPPVINVDSRANIELCSLERSYPDHTHMCVRGSGYTSPNPRIAWEFERVQWDCKVAFIRI